RLDPDAQSWPRADLCAPEEGLRGGGRVVVGPARPVGRPHRSAREICHRRQEGKIQMNSPAEPEGDLTISRVIKAPRSAIWKAWTDPRSFEQWWIPAPYKCRVIDMKVSAGGAFVT